MFFLAEGCIREVSGVQPGALPVYVRPSTPAGGSRGEYCTMCARLMQRCRVDEEGHRMVTYCQRVGRQ